MDAIVAAVRATARSGLVRNLGARLALHPQRALCVIAPLARRPSPLLHPQFWNVPKRRTHCEVEWLQFSGHSCTERQCEFGNWAYTDGLNEQERGRPHTAPRREPLALRPLKP